jgi:hypothetical protein
MSHFALMKAREEEEEDDKQDQPPSEYQQQLSQAMIGQQAAANTKILSFKNVCSVDSMLPKNFFFLSVAYMSSPICLANRAVLSSSGLGP